ncbi:MAG: hypothetical protein N2318_10790, partial [Meiothermus sp.]|nr:hypothetical protein [Meiothermus sp.]
LIGAALAQELRALGYAIQAVPLVGRGQPYEKAGFCVRGPRREMPSGASPCKAQRPSGPTSGPAGSR